MRVSVIIPTHNEAQAIERVLADIPPDLATEVIVVDSNSNDATPEIAASLGARVFRSPAADMGERVSPAWPRRILRTWLCSWMATTATGPPSCRFS